MRGVAKLQREIAGGVANQVGFHDRPKEWLQRHDATVFAHAARDPVNARKGLQRMFAETGLVATVGLQDVVVVQTKDAVLVMQRGKDQSVQTVAQADKASESLQTITKSVSTITQMNIQIATAAEQQTAVAADISRSIHQIAQLADQAANNASELAKSTGELTGLEQRLSALVSRFRV